MKKTLPVAISGSLAASAMVLLAPGTAQAGNCTPFDGGGYTQYICGKVFNRATRNVAVAKNSPSTYYKTVAPGGYAGSDGVNQPGVDIDGFRVPAGCYFTWTYTGPAPSKYSNDSIGTWYKITDVTIVTIKTTTC